MSNPDIMKYMDRLKKLQKKVTAQ
ncbi:MAG: hypothetical protein EZS28_019999, partial [Streblomastix strix]